MVRLDSQDRSNKPTPLVTELEEPLVIFIILVGRIMVFMNNNYYD